MRSNDTVWLESGLEWPHPHARVPWGGAPCEEISRSQLFPTLCEASAALQVSLVRTGRLQAGRWARGAGWTLLTSVSQAGMGTVPPF